MLKQTPTLSDCQAFHRWLDREKGFSEDLPTNVMLLVEEVGEVAKEVRRLLHATDDAVRQGAHDHLREELADCLAFIAKLANYTDIDLQQAYVEKMTKNIGRNWLE